MTETPMDHGSTWHAVLSSIAVVIALTACTSTRPQPQFVDRMVFVEDDAIEPVDPAQRDLSKSQLRPNRRTSQAAGRERPTQPALARARCMNRRASNASSIGRATQGQLVDGCLLPKRGPGWVRRNKSGFGTDETVALVQWALAEVVGIYPNTTPVIIGALSKPGGGPLPRHRSHQSGRDIDIGYYASDNRALPHFRDMSSDNIDIDKTWALIGALLHSGRVHMIFMDYNLQALLYQYLHDEGTAERTLRRIFQYPAGRNLRTGIIRHARGHRDHFHVRLRCPMTDRDHCVN